MDSDFYIYEVTICFLSELKWIIYVERAGILEIIAQSSKFILQAEVHGSKLTFL